MVAKLLMVSTDKEQYAPSIAMQVAKLCSVTSCLHGFALFSLVVVHVMHLLVYPRYLSNNVRGNHLKMTPMSARGKVFKLLYPTIYLPDILRPFPHSECSAD